MSKATLKKELKNMSREQMEQIILDAYDARKETKEYFDFFLNPDVDKLFEKFKLKCSKELNKQKWGMCKARTSVLKKAVKDFLGLQPGTEADINMFFLMLSMLGVTERYTNFAQPLVNYCGFVMKQLLDYAESHQIVSDVMPRVEALLRNDVYTVYFRRLLREAIDER